MIEIRNLIKNFGEKCAVNIGQLDIKDGELIGLVGNNGAGKTTLFRLMLDLLRADSGYVLIDGTDVSKSEEWKINTGAFVDSGFLIDYLTPEEFFYFIGKAYGLSESDVGERLAHFSNFMSGEIVGAKKFIRSLSMGNKQKVGIISAMLHAPKLLILDEPFNFLDPTSQLYVKEFLDEYCRTTGATVIISSHNLNYTIDVCSRVIVLESGLVVCDKHKDEEDFEQKLNDYFVIKTDEQTV